MKQIILYKIYNDEESRYIYTREKQSFSDSEKYYRLEAEDNCYLQNILTQSIFKVIVIPYHELVFWVERTYK